MRLYSYLCVSNLSLWQHLSLSVMPKLLSNNTHIGNWIFIFVCQLYLRSLIYWQGVSCCYLAPVLQTIGNSTLCQSGKLRTSSSIGSELCWFELMRFSCLIKRTSKTDLRSLIYLKVWLIEAIYHWVLCRLHGDLKKFKL